MPENENQQSSEPPRSDHDQLVPATPRSDESHREHDHRDESRLPTKKEILLKLDRMPGLIAFGVLTPARSNAMKGVYHTMLSHLGDTTPGSDTAIGDEDVIKLVRQKPELLEFLKPFLTPEQFELIVSEAPRDT